MTDRDISHDEQIARWAKFVRENPDEWKKHLKKFLDAQIIMANRFYMKLSESEDGRRKIKLMGKSAGQL